MGGQFFGDLILPSRESGVAFVAMAEVPPGSFVYRTQTHYDQLDGQMLLHHPRYFIFVERAQQAWMEALLGAPRFDWRNFPDLYLVVRKVEAEYLQSIDGVVDIAVLLRPVRMRAAKLEIAFSIRTPDLEIEYCRGHRLTGKVDPQTHQPVFWSEELRAAVEAEIQIQTQESPPGVP